MKKYIFLDIDGVIATPEIVVDGLWALVDEKQDMLEDILKRTNADIVLSSSWRRADLEHTHHHMNEQGFRFTDKIIGQTIRAYNYIDRSKKIHLSMPRGVEIKQWLDANVHSNNGKDWDRKKLGVDYNFVILDDDSGMLYNHRHHFIHTDCYQGLTRDDVELAVEILNKKK